MYDVPDGSVLGCRGMQVGRLPRKHPFFWFRQEFYLRLDFSSAMFMSALSTLMKSFSRLFSLVSLFSLVISISFGES